MTELSKEGPVSALVNSDDIDELFLEDFDDPTHGNRWKDFAQSEPILAREILNKAKLEADVVFDSVEDKVKSNIDFATYVFSAIKRAAQRRID